MRTCEICGEDTNQREREICGEWTNQRFCSSCETKIKSIMEKMLPVSVRLAKKI